MTSGMFLTIAYLLIIGGFLTWLIWDVIHAPVHPIKDDELP